MFKNHLSELLNERVNRFGIFTFIVLCFSFFKFVIKSEGDYLYKNDEKVNLVNFEAKKYNLLVFYHYSAGNSFHSLNGFSKFKKKIDKRIQNQNIHLVLPVNSDLLNDSSIIAYQRKNAMIYNIDAENFALDLGKALQQKYEIDHFPCLVLLNPMGKVIWKKEGIVVFNEDLIIELSKLIL